MAVAVDAALRIADQLPRHPLQHQRGAEGAVPLPRGDRARRDLRRAAVRHSGHHHGPRRQPRLGSRCRADYTHLPAGRHDPRQAGARDPELVLDELRPAFVDEVVTHLQGVAVVADAEVTRQAAGDEVGGAEVIASAGEALRLVAPEPHQLWQGEGGVEAVTEPVAKGAAGCVGLLCLSSRAQVVVHQGGAEGTPVLPGEHDRARGGGDRNARDLRRAASLLAQPRQPQPDRLGHRFPPRSRILLCPPGREARGCSYRKRDAPLAQHGAALVAE